MTIFEKIINKEISAHIIYEDEDFIAFNDNNPLAPVHILVIPKMRSEDVQDITSYDLSKLQNLFEIIKNIAIKYGVDKTGYRILTNVGDDAGQTIKHMHFHILGGKKLGKPC